MPMEWVGPLISGAAVVLVAIIEAAAARERKRIKSDNQKSDALMNGVQEAAGSNPVTRTKKC